MTAGPASRPDQVVEVWAEDPADPENASFGSGYLISPQLVLTARHVVRPAGPGTIVFSTRSPDRPSIVDADVVWTGTALDMALLRVRWPDGRPPWTVTPATIGDVPNPGWQLDFRAMGYPRRKARPLAGGDTLRDCDEVSGGILAQRNARSGRLDLSLAVDPAGPGKAWSGFSGAAVFAHGFLIGVVIQAERVTAGFTAERVAIPAGAPLKVYPDFTEPQESIARFRGLLTDDGNDVSVYPARRRPQYRSTVEKVPPAGGPLDRTAELAKMRAFARPASGGGRVRPYEDWVATAWAGKTALAGEFARHPPPGADVVAFFVSRPREQQTPQFLAEACDQLAALVNEPRPLDPAPGAFARLWDDAAAEARRAGRTLLLLIDGLDENDPREVPAIASLIPDIPGDEERCQRVLLLRRDPPELDVDDGHALTEPGNCEHRNLVPSPHAEARKREARRVLREFLRDPQAARALGIIAAAGPLQPAEIAAVRQIEDPAAAGRDTRLIATEEVRPLLQQGVELGLLWPADDETKAYSFQHADLLELAAAELGQEAIAAHQDAIRSWAGGYEADGWPAATPSYLLVGYPAFLARIPDAASLAALTTPARVRRLRASTGDDAAAADELTLSLRQLAAADQPDLAAGLRLALRREALLGALARYPADLVCAHARLGHWTRARRLAARLAAPADQAGALSAMGEMAAAAGQLKFADEAFTAALTAAGKVHDSRQRAALAMTTAQAAARSRRLLGPKAVAAALAGPADAVTCLTHFAMGHAVMGDVDYAEMFLAEATAVARPLDQPPQTARAEGIPHPDAPPAGPAAAVARPGDLWGAATLAANARYRATQNSLVLAASAVAAKAIELERLDVAIRIAASQPDPIARHIVARELTHAATSGSAEQTGRLLAEAQADAAGESDPKSRVLLMCATAQALAATGRPAEDLIGPPARIAAGIEDNGERAAALAATAQAAAAIGLPADHLIAAARQAAGLEADDARRFAAQNYTAQVAALIGRADLARGAAADIRDPVQQAWAHAAIFTALCSTWQFEAVRGLGWDMPDRAQLDWAWSTAAPGAAACGQLGTAWSLASAVSDPELRNQAHGGVAMALARAGQFDAARQAAGFVTDPGGRAAALSAVATAIAGTGQVDAARQTAADLPEQGQRTAALLNIARAATTAGQVPAALAIARDMPDLRWQAWTLEAVSGDAAASGQFSAAIQAADAIVTPILRARALVAIAAAACRARQLDVARAAARKVTIPDARARALAATALAARSGPLSGELITEARQAAGAVASARPRALALAGVASAAAEAGQAALAADLLGAAEALALAGDPGQRAAVLAAMARASDGAPDRAEQLFAQACHAADLADPVERCTALAEIGRYAAGRPGWPERLSAESAQAEDISDPDERSTALDALARAADVGGHPELAWQTAQRIPLPGRRIGTLLHLARSAARPRPDEADTLIEAAIQAARDGDAAAADPVALASWTLPGIAVAAAACLRLRVARDAAAAISDETERATVIATIDVAEEAAGPEPAEGDEELPWWLPPSSQQNFQLQSAMTVAAWAAYRAGWLATASSLLSQLNDPGERGQLLTAIAEAALATGDPSHALSVIDRATASAGPADRAVRGRLLALRVRAIALAGPPAAARALAAGLADCFSPDLILVAADLGQQVVDGLAEELR
jgi:hypothetical protein